MSNEQKLTKFGSMTPRASIYKSESHKLCQAFPVKTGDAIREGSPVKMNTDGTISPFTGDGVYLGIATSFSSNSPYPENNSMIEMTVMVSGFAIVYGVANAEIAAAGVVTPKGVTTEGYTSYGTATEAADIANPKFIALNITSKDGLVQILVR